MITLPKILVSETDMTSAAQSATGDAAGGAQDFLALLSGALSGKAGKTGKLTLASLQQASQTLPQGETKTTLSKLLAQQGEDDAQKLDLTKLTDAQSVLSALTPEMKSDVVKQLSKDLQKSDDKPTLNDEEMAGLSALMAMLPHSTTQPVAAPAAGAVTAADGAGAKGFAELTPAASPANTGGSGHTVGKDLALAQTVHNIQATHADNVGSQITPLVAETTANTDANSTMSAAAPAFSVPPVISNATATVNTHPVVTVNSQLGSQEWQQNVSQHITLFTRQGQQTAELKLHPENLGQVNITLKIDDNQAQIQMVSPHSHVRAALEAAIPTLRTQLADNGIQLAQSNVSSESFAGQQQQQSSFGHSSSQRSAEAQANASDNEETLAVPASLQSRARGNGSVDTFA